MTITVQYWKRLNSMEPDYDSGPIIKEIEGDCAATCMSIIRDMKYNNDCVKFTPIEIMNVED